MMINEFDIEELVRGMGNLDDDVDVFDYVFDRYEMDWSNFCGLIRELMPLIVVGESPLTGKSYSGFGKDNMFFIKQEIK